MGRDGEYGNNIEGVPLPGDLPQVSGSAAPNRDDTSLLSNPTGERESEFPVDNFDALEHLAESDPASSYVSNKDDQQWSPGLEDEENDYGLVSFSELDSDSNEGLYPETQPLHTDESSSLEQNYTELTDIQLRPDNLQYGPE